MAEFRALALDCPKLITHKIQLIEVSQNYVLYFFFNQNQIFFN